MLVYGLFFVFAVLPCVFSELKHVHIIYRHGDRGPMSVYPRDPHQADAWPEGLGQLTKLGKQQHFALGKYFRKRYAGYLSPQYKMTELYVRASDVDRTLMSAESNLAGLYLPANKNDRFNPDLRWNPIPIHTVPTDEDPLLRGGDVCPRLDQLVNDVSSISISICLFVLMCMDMFLLIQKIHVCVLKVRFRLNGCLSMPSL